MIDYVLVISGVATAVSYVAVSIPKGKAFVVLTGENHMPAS